MALMGRVPNLLLFLSWPNLSTEMMDGTWILYMLVKLNIFFYKICKNNLAYVLRCYFFVNLKFYRFQYSIVLEVFLIFNMTEKKTFHSKFLQIIIMPFFSLCTGVLRLTLSMKIERLFKGCAMVYLYINTLSS